MTVEAATHISDLNSSYPAGGDPKSEGDDHVRLIKSVLVTDFANIAGAVTASHTELNILDGATLSTAELNILDGVTATAAELNILDGVTASTAELNVLDGITASTAELNYCDGVTSPIQTQLDAKTPGLVLLSTVTASASATVDLETTFDSTYEEYMVVLSGIVPSTTATPWLRLKVGGSYRTTGYEYAATTCDTASGSNGTLTATSASRVEVGGTMTTGYHMDLVAYIHNPAGTSLRKSVHWKSTQVYSGGVAVITGAGTYDSATSALTGLRLMFSTGNVASGTARLYGIRKT